MPLTFRNLLARSATCLVSQEDQLHLRPAILLRWCNPDTMATEEHVADIVMAFSVTPPADEVALASGDSAAVATAAKVSAKRKKPAPDLRTVWLLVQWHFFAKAEAGLKLPHLTTVLQDSFSIVPITDMICTVRVLPQFGHFPPTWQPDGGKRRVFAIVNKPPLSVG